METKLYSKLWKAYDNAMEVEDYNGARNITNQLYELAFEDYRKFCDQKKQILNDKPKGLLAFLSRKLNKINLESTDKSIASMKETMEFIASTARHLSFIEDLDVNDKNKENKLKGGFE